MSLKAVFPQVLLVEDEPLLAQTLIVALERIELEPRHAATLTEARKLIQEGAPDLIILDLSLPDGDGLEFCQELRNKNAYQGTVLMLTARGRTEDRVLGLDAGADDYLAKPFSWEELAARIRALGRRRNRSEPPADHQAHAARMQSPPRHHSQPQPGEVHPLWSVDHSRLRIFGHQGWQELTPLEFKLATYLMDAKGAIVSRDDLLKHVWGFTLLPKTRTVDQFLGRLRKRLETDADSPEHFLTIRGAGYRFEKG